MTNPVDSPDREDDERWALVIPGQGYEEGDAREERQSQDLRATCSVPLHGSLLTPHLSTAGM